MERVRFNQTRSCGFPHFFDYFLFGCPLFIWDIFPQFPQFYLENPLKRKNSDNQRIEAIVS